VAAAFLYGHRFISVCSPFQVTASRSPFMASVIGVTRHRAPVGASPLDVERAVGFVHLAHHAELAGPGQRVAPTISGADGRIAAAAAECCCPPPSGPNCGSEAKQVRSRRSARPCKAQHSRIPFLPQLRPVIQPLPDLALEAALGRIVELLAAERFGK
jgi:hypothetical protein